MHIPVIAVDFDNTMAKYAGWRGEGFAEITGEPMPGVRETIEKWRVHALVFVFSVRCGFKGGAAAIVNWLERWHIEVDGVAIHKPRADVYVDDLGLRFIDWKTTDAWLTATGLLPTSAADEAETTRRIRNSRA